MLWEFGGISIEIPIKSKIISLCSSAAKHDFRILGQNSRGQKVLKISDISNYDHGFQVEIAIKKDIQFGCPSSYTHVLVEISGIEPLTS